MEPKSNYRIHSNLPLANSAALITPFYPVSCHVILYLSAPNIFLTVISRTPSVHVPPLTWETKFHTHNNGEAKLGIIHTEGAMPLQCSDHVVSLRFSLCHPIWITQWDRVRFQQAGPCPCRAPNVPPWKKILKATILYCRGTAVHGWTSRPPLNGLWARQAKVSQVLPGYHADFTKVVIRMLINHEMNCSWRLSK
jgi:hypothetical protein